MQWAPEPFQTAAHAMPLHGMGWVFRFDMTPLRARRWLCVSREGLGDQREPRGSGCSLRQWNNLTSKSLEVGMVNLKGTPFLGEKKTDNLTTSSK